MHPIGASYEPQASASTTRLYRRKSLIFTPRLSWTGRAGDDYSYLLTDRMPQFELEDPEIGRDTERVRAHSAEDAVRRWLKLAPDESVELDKPEAAMEELEGWREVRVAGEPRGRVRPFHRMRFRRD